MGECRCVGFIEQGIQAFVISVRESTSNTRQSSVLKGVGVASVGAVSSGVPARVRPIAASACDCANTDQPRYSELRARPAAFQRRALAGARLRSRSAATRPTASGTVNSGSMMNTLPSPTGQSENGSNSWVP